MFKLKDIFNNINNIKVQKKKSSRKSTNIQDKELEKIKKQIITYIIKYNFLQDPKNNIIQQISRKAMEKGGEKIELTHELVKELDITI